MNTQILWNHFFKLTPEKKMADEHQDDDSQFAINTFVSWAPVGQTNKSLRGHAKEKRATLVELPTAENKDESKDENKDESESESEGEGEGEYEDEGENESEGENDSD
jgi:hypothetical protein